MGLKSFFKNLFKKEVEIIKETIVEELQPTKVEEPKIKDIDLENFYKEEVVETTVSTETCQPEADGSFTIVESKLPVDSKPKKEKPKSKPKKKSTPKPKKSEGKK